MLEKADSFCGEATVEYFVREKTFALCSICFCGTLSLSDWGGYSEVVEAIIIKAPLTGSFLKRRLNPIANFA
jgi:hypothetical protein